ncbi:MAG: holo-ACP synthase [Chloroflexi bacterium]|nr:holo-ACP synthase [Chloroflexota bacterium]
MQRIGVDIIEVARIKKAIERWDGRFLRRVYTERELSVCKNRAWMLAARFAGKEAVMKAMGTGRKGVAWGEVEVLSGGGSKPSVRLHGRARALAWKLGLDEFEISLSHTRDYAVAMVVGEQK